MATSGRATSCGRRLSHRRHRLGGRGAWDPLADVANARLELLWAWGPAAMAAFTVDYLAAALVDAAHLALLGIQARRCDLRASCRRGLTPPPHAPCVTNIAGLSPRHWRI
ncbi:MAG: hypothetical protein R2838_15790 [Caldilineaceae bacterium]